MSKEECNFKHKGKCFKTNIAKRHYIQTDESLKKAMAKYTAWLDGQHNFANVDENVD